MEKEDATAYPEIALEAVTARPTLSQFKSLTIG